MDSGRGRRFASTRCALAKGATWSARRSPGRAAPGGAQPVLVYATAEPAAVQAVQAALGVDRAGALVEHALARIAQGLVGEPGVRQLVVAGGETSGAVVQALGVQRCASARRSTPACPGRRPWPGRCTWRLKSGNFGGVDFFTKALRQVA
jgi:uncharacterized protein YgbK (DUF1537 family)